MCAVPIPPALCQTHPRRFGIVVPSRGYRVARPSKADPAQSGNLTAVTAFGLSSDSRSARDKCFDWMTMRTRLDEGHRQKNQNQHGISQILRLPWLPQVVRTGVETCLSSRNFRSMDHARPALHPGPVCRRASLAEIATASSVGTMCRGASAPCSARVSQSGRDAADGQDPEQAVRTGGIRR